MSQYDSIPITQLPPGVTVLGTDVFPAVDTLDDTESPSGTTYKYTVAQLAEYVIGISTGSNIESAYVATTASLTATYNNGISDDGIGATLTNAGTLVALAIDGVTLAVGERVLVKDQAAPADNGVYVVTTEGSNVVAWVMTRATDYDSSVRNPMQGDFIAIVSGSDNAETIWIETAPNPIVIGTSAIIFEKVGISGLVNPVVNAIVKVENLAGDLISSGVFIDNSNNVTGALSVDAGNLLLSGSSISDLGTGFPMLEFFSPPDDANHFKLFSGGTNIALEAVGADPVINMLFASKSGGISFYNGGGILPMLTLAGVPTPANYIEIANSNTGSGPTIQSIGTDTNIPLSIVSKGTGNIAFYGAGLAPMLNLGTVAVPVNYINMANSATGSGPIIAAVGADINVDLNLEPQAAGNVLVTHDPTVPLAVATKQYVDAAIVGASPWVSVAGTSQLVADDVNYIPLNGSLTTFTLPATAPVGFRFNIEGLGAGGWLIQAGGGQYIRFLSTLSSAGGTCASFSQYDNCAVVCVTANVEFKLMSGGSARLQFT